jgi:hypothetical protein
MKETCGVNLNTSHPLPKVGGIHILPRTKLTILKNQAMECNRATDYTIHQKQEWYSKKGLIADKFRIIHQKSRPL